MSLVMPASWAMAAVRCGVRCSLMFMNTVFTEFAVAWYRLMLPQLLFSALFTTSLMPLKCWPELPLNIVLKFTPSWAAPSSANGFIVEPGWNWACVALLSWCVR